MTSYSQIRGFNAIEVLGWIRSEVAENYRPARSAVLVSDPWFAVDFDYQTAYAYEPKAVTW